MTEGESDFYTSPGNFCEIQHVFSTSNTYIFSLPIVKNQIFEKKLTHPNGYEEHWMMEIYHDNGDIESLRGSKLSEQKVVERNHSERAILASNEANGKCSCDTNNCNDH